MQQDNFFIASQSIKSLLNPTRRLDCEEHTYLSGLAGVFNPELRRVEWKTAYLSGVCGVVAHAQSISSCNWMIDFDED